MLKDSLKNNFKELILKVGFIVFWFIVFLGNTHGAQMEKDIIKIKEKWESKLLSYPNVVGVAVGLCQRKGKYTDEKCIVVYVKKKIDPAYLKPEEIIPEELDGIPVDVQESGEFRAY